MQNLNKNYYFNKIEYFKNLKKNFKNSLDILNKIKNNFQQSYILYNGVHKSTYLSFLSATKNIKSKYLEKILLLISPITFAKPIEIIKKNLDNNYHIIFNKASIKYSITYHCLAKQFNCQTNINIFKLDDFSNIIEDMTFRLSIVIDLTNSEPILFSLSK